MKSTRPPLVLIPGMMCDARLFAPQIAALSGQYDIHLSSIAHADTMADLARDILAAAPPRFALAGLSMGGIVAMEVLRQAPKRVARLALLDTNPLAEQEEVKARRGPQMQAVAQGQLARLMREEISPNYLADCTQEAREQAARSAILDLCVTMAVDLGAEVFLRQSRALMARPDQSETLRQSKIPTLILCGRHDKLCPLARHQLMASLMPHARLTVIEQAGHLPTLEQPEQTNAALTDWLASS